VIPKPQHTIAMRLKICGAIAVARGLPFVIVLATIHFNDQPLRVTCEVREIRPDGRLPAEMRRTARQLAQIAPKFLLGICHVAAKAPRRLNTAVNRTQRAHRPPPLTPPLRKRGEGNAPPLRL
jgi:hypothetical protein